LFTAIYLNNAEHWLNRSAQQAADGTGYCAYGEPAAGSP